MNKTQNIVQVYDDSTIFGSLDIPQYDMELKDYVNAKPNQTPDIIRDKVIPLLEESAKLNYYGAFIQLADFYLMGYHSIETNYLKAKEYYERAVEISSDGHSYFMLGFIYSSGLFGEVEIDQAKATLYFQTGMENGDIDSMIALAYRNAYGIGTPTNCDLSLVYYSKVAQLGMDYLQKTNYTVDVDDSVYNVKLVDFNGGIYGDKLSESVKSVVSKERIYAENRRAFEEFNIDGNEYEFVSSYYNALRYYDGDYFIQKDYPKATKYLQQCVDLGEQMYGSNKYKHINTMDRFYLSRCQAMLGHIYLTGQGVVKDVVKANSLLTTSLLVQEISDALNDLGYIKENQLLGTPDEKAEVKATELYTKAVKLGSNEARLNLAKLLTSMSPDGEPLRGEYAKGIYFNVRRAVYNGNRESLFYLGDYLQSGLAQKVDSDKLHDCQSMVFYYKMFVERMESHFFPHLKYGFDELAKGNYKNSLLAYSIAAEQGLEYSQISASYLLYQMQPLWSLKPVKTFDAERVESSIRYLERASRQKNTDATILLGDLYMNGIENGILEKDYTKAFAYFKKASNDHSSHGAYKLGHMYEYGLGPQDNSVDYFMAKRFYDLSIQYQDANKRSRTSNKTAINWALLRLRMKYLFNRKKFKSENSEVEKSGWLDSFRKIRGGSRSNEVDKANERARAHHEGGLYDGDDYEEFDILDYVVVFLTFAFFLSFFIQNVIRRIRRAGDQPNENNEENQEGNNQDLRGQFNIRGVNFEFHFFAL
ncbi:responsible for ER-associated degradation of numerous ER-resident protein [Scheffersomyces coipomensis]|uniref:responsible for ER-associated degradation of numerous ER-resident protein n=1 Tax=Scheffersomyces coipomensis TaxID=1788519 RepID=UPI00315CB9BF